MNMESSTPSSDPAAIRATATAWWIRLDSDKANARDRDAFARWLAIDPRHGLAFDAVCALWGELDAIRERIATPTTGARRRRLLPGIRVAPALVFCCLAIGLFSPISLWLRADYRSGFGEMLDIRLNDGSTVHLNGNSALAVDIDDHQRRLILLDGEAWFEVNPDSARPFQVQAGPATVTALGTAFNIRLHSRIFLWPASTGMVPARCVSAGKTS
jgi:transmembrane sensor